VNSREFVQLFNDYPVLKELEQELIAGKTRTNLLGAIGSFKPIVFNHLHNHLNTSILVCCKDSEHAEYVYSDIENLTEDNNTYLWKDSFRKTFDLNTADAHKIQVNASVLDAFSNSDKPVIVVTHPAALAEKIIDESDFEKSKLIFKVGEKVDLDFLIEVLNEYAFYREDFVYEPGQFSIRGGIIDLYSFASELPVRLVLRWTRY
jgi:transcription-repair coupling factor (superfamily II helicase)